LKAVASIKRPLARDRRSEQDSPAVWPSLAQVEAGLPQLKNESPLG
jgi:hypothetical protein